MDELLLEECMEKMEASIANLQKNLATLHVGHATPAMLNDVTFLYYGDPSPINYAASITSQGANVLIVKPFDKGDLKAILAALNEANLGVNPINEGDSIRLVFPALTEERRKEYVKTAKKYAEEGKVAVRNIRRDYNDIVKKDKDSSEDLRNSMLDEIQKATDDAIKRMDDITGKKEIEIMKI